MGQVFPPLVYCFDGQIAEKEMFKRWSCLSHCLSLAADTVVSIVTCRSEEIVEFFIFDLVCGTTRFYR